MLLQLVAAVGGTVFYASAHAISSQLSSSDLATFSVCERAATLTCYSTLLSMGLYALGDYLYRSFRTRPCTEVEMTKQRRASQAAAAKSHQLASHDIHSVSDEAMLAALRERQRFLADWDRRRQECLDACHR